MKFFNVRKFLVMKKVILQLAVLAAGIVGCTKNNNGPSNQASVMYVNGCAGTTDIYAQANGITVNGATSLAFLSNSGYQNVTAGSTVPMQFILNNLGTPLCNGSPDITAGDHYSVFAGGLVTGPTFVVTTDNFLSLPSGNAAVRFINLSNDTLNESFYVGSQKLDSNVSDGTYSQFAEISATNGVQVLVQDPSKPTQIAVLYNQAFLAGKNYTVILTGTSSGSGASALALTVIDNN